MRFPLPPPVRQALSQLETCGHEAYLVGGCVRDDVLGIQPCEYDICTSATPSQVHICFKGEQVLDTGARHGTVTLRLSHMPLEITTFRTDGSYTDSRRPDSVSFGTTLLEDLKRRDFTANAMAWSQGSGLVDPFHGYEACQKMLLVAVGDPRQRFKEDALRVLRALRFAAVIGFNIDPETYQAMVNERDRLAFISRERIAGELNRILLGGWVVETLRTYPRIFWAVLPQLEPMQRCPQRSRFHVYDVWEHTLQCIGYTPEELALRWAALFHDSGKPATTTCDSDGTTHFRGHQHISVRLATACMEELRQPRKLTETVRALILHHDARIGTDNLQKWVSLLGIGLFKQLMQLKHADQMAHAPHVSRHAHKSLDLIKAAETLVQSGACLSLKDLKVNGNSLLSLGFPKDKLIGLTLQELLDSVLSGQVANEPDALKALAQAKLAAKSIKEKP
jgi:tRNA nucleotidyltransferase (CCA-adding enzyme)